MDDSEDDLDLDCQLALHFEDIAAVAPRQGGAGSQDRLPQPVPPASREVQTTGSPKCVALAVVDTGDARAAGETQAGGSAAAARCSTVTVRFRHGDPL